jgi:hypothetical protein
MPTPIPGMFARAAGSTQAHRDPARTRFPYPGAPWAAPLTAPRRARYHPMRGMGGKLPSERARGSVPVTVVGGSLGAGKTTLLNHLLQSVGGCDDAEGLRLGVIVNDFGSIGVDAALIVGVGGDMVQLGNGCICCTMQGDLLDALSRVLDGPEPPDHVIMQWMRRVLPTREAG